MADQFEKTSLNMKITLDIDDQLTWGELVKFVELGRQTTSPGDPVGLEYSEHDQCFTGLTCYVAGEDLKG